MATVINRAIYFNIGGGRKQCSSLYMNSGGSRKTISSAFANIGGARKQIHPYSATTTYTWNKYDIEYELWLMDWGTEETNFGSACQVYAISSYSLVESSTWTYGVGISITSCSFYSDMKDGLSMPSGYWICSVGEPASYNDVGGIYSGGTMSYEDDTYYIRGCHRYQGRKSSGKGSYIGTVTSSNRNTYPDNGKSGSYWYVFVS